MSLTSFVLVMFLLLYILVDWLWTKIKRYQNRKVLDHLMTFYANRVSQKELIPMLYQSLKHRDDLYKCKYAQSKEKTESYLSFKGDQSDNFDYDASFMIANPSLTMD